MFRCLGLYPIVQKISPFAYELDLLTDNHIYFMIFIAYLTRYYASDDLYNRILSFSGPVEYGLESDSMSGDDERDGKCWELECVIDHKNRRSTAWYLVCWKGYGSKEDL